MKQTKFVPDGKSYATKRYLCVDYSTTGQADMNATRTHPVELPACEFVELIHGKPVNDGARNGLDR